MNKTILITGASSGIGKATAIYFQEKGWNVIATMRTPENEKDLITLDNVLIAKLDVQNINSINSAMAQGIEKFGKIDVLLNNAGYGLAGTFESMSKETIKRQFDVNVFGLFDVTQAILPHFRQNKNGVIINVSSVGGKMTFPLFSMYHATKFAVEGFSEALHYELKPTGIQVKIVEPGAIATDFSGRSLDMNHNSDLTDYNDFVTTILNGFESRINSGNSSTPDMVAEVIYRAATENSEEMRYIAGADAEQMIAARKELSDPEFFQLLKGQFNL